MRLRFTIRDLLWLTVAAAGIAMVGSSVILGAASADLRPSVAIQSICGILLLYTALVRWILLSE